MTQLLIATLITAELYQLNKPIKRQQKRKSRHYELVNAITFYQQTIEASYYPQIYNHELRRSNTRENVDFDIQPCVTRVNQKSILRCLITSKALELLSPMAERKTAPMLCFTVGTQLISNRGKRKINKEKGKCSRLDCELM